MKTTHLVDPIWQEHATTNAIAGFPWAVWCFDNDAPGGLMDSKRTEAEAQRYADELRSMTRKGRTRVVIVCDETPEAFTLHNDPPKPAAAKLPKDERRQGVLFAGLDCLPGQEDLFQTDGA